MKQTFYIEGMSCSSCVNTIEKALKKCDGIEDVKVNLLTHNMIADFDEHKIEADNIVKTINHLGYKARTQEKEDGLSAKDSNLKSTENTKLYVTLAFFVPLFVVSMGSMGYLPGFKFLSHLPQIVLAFTQFLLLLPIVVLNFHYFSQGFTSLVHGRPNMNSLVALSSTASIVHGIYTLYAMMLMPMAHEVMNHGHAVYFEGAGMILAFVSIGKFLEERAKVKTKSAINDLLKLKPTTATKEDNGKLISISIEDIHTGDVLWVRNGESVPVDGMVLEGKAYIDESMMTGESLGKEKSVGDSVVGASIVKGGHIKMRATKVGDDTALAQIIKLINDATTSKAPIARLADKISAIFVPSILGIAMMSFIVWRLCGASFDFALNIAISVLVISCPCALGLATPTAIMVGNGVGAKHNIIFKSAESLELTHQCTSILLDKTGTLTEGKPSVKTVLNFTDDDTLWKKVASIERFSTHPFAKAIVDYVKQGNNYHVEHFKEHEGEGVEGIIDGKAYYVGNQRLLERLGVDAPTLKPEQINASETPLYIVEEQACLGVITLVDALKPTSKTAVQNMQAMGYDVCMLTGDNGSVAQNIAQSVGIKHYFADVLPSDKENYVRKLQADGKKVIMVGDGINDAPALVRADIGMAIGSGTDVAIDSADVVLMKSDVMDVYNALKISKRTIINIKENLFWAFIYNALSIPIACGLLYPSLGLTLTPMIASFAMSVSSLFVVGNALRLKYMMKIKETKAMTCSKTVYIEGMMCMHCVKHVEKALKALAGVDNVAVSLEGKSATITSQCNIENEAITKAIEDAGYSIIKIEQNA